MRRNSEYEGETLGMRAFKYSRLNRSSLWWEILDRFNYVQPNNWPSNRKETWKNEPENPSRLGELDLLREKTAYLISSSVGKEASIEFCSAVTVGPSMLNKEPSITEGEGWNKFEKYLTAASWISVGSFKRVSSSLIWSILFTRPVPWLKGGKTWCNRPSFERLYSGFLLPMDLFICPCLRRLWSLASAEMRSEVKE